MIRNDCECVFSACLKPGGLKTINAASIKNYAVIIIKQMIPRPRQKWSHECFSKSPQIMPFDAYILILKQWKSS